MRQSNFMVMSRRRFANPAGRQPSGSEFLRQQQSGTGAISVGAPAPPTQEAIERHAIKLLFCRSANLGLGAGANVSQLAPGLFAAACSRRWRLAARCHWRRLRAAKVAWPKLATGSWWQSGPNLCIHMQNYLIWSSELAAALPLAGGRARAYKHAKPAGEPT